MLASGAMSSTRLTFTLENDLAEQGRARPQGAAPPPQLEPGSPGQCGRRWPHRIVVRSQRQPEQVDSFWVEAEALGQE